jgi:hypothetical protein
LIRPDAWFSFSGSSSRHNSPQPNPTTESWKSDLIDIIITRHTVSSLGGRHRTQLYTIHWLFFVCYTNALKRRRRGATSRWAHIAGRSDGSGRRSVVQYVVDTLFFFSFSPEVDAWPSSPPSASSLNIPAVGSICVPLLFEDISSSFVVGGKFVCDWGHLESRLSGRLVSSCLPRVVCVENNTV